MTTARTTRLQLSLDFLGHVQTEQELAKNFELLDKLSPPPAVLADVGKTLKLVNVGGVAVPQWVA